VRWDKLIKIFTKRLLTYQPPPPPPPPPPPEDPPPPEPEEDPGAAEDDARAELNELPREREKLLRSCACQ